MKHLFLAIVSISLLIGSTSHAGGFYSGLPQFEFSATDYQMGAPSDASFDSAAAFKECQSVLASQESLVQKQGYTIVDEQPCAVRKTTSGTFVEGRFKLLK